MKDQSLADRFRERIAQIDKVLKRIEAGIYQGDFDPELGREEDRFLRGIVPEVADLIEAAQEAYGLVSDNPDHTVQEAEDILFKALAALRERIDDGE